MKTETMHVFMYTELEKTLKELYGIEVRLLDEPFIFSERIGHYTYHEFDVDPVEGCLFSVGDDEIVAKWIQTGRMTNLDMRDVEVYDWSDTADVGLEHIMHRLFIEGHIPAGKYLMQVDW